MLFDLFPPWTRSLKILAAVTLDFWLAALAVFDLVAQLLQTVCKFRAIHSGGVLLRAIEFLRLQRARFTIFCLGQVEDDDMRVKLRRCITVYWPRAVVLKSRGDAVARCLWRKIPSKPGLDIALQFIQCNPNTSSMGFLYPFISAHERSQRDALRCGERRIPPSAVLHRLDRTALLVHIFPRRLITNQLLASNRVLAIAEPSKVLLLHRAVQPPFLGQFSVPLAAYPLAFAVVILLCVAELLLMVRTSLTCTERFGNSQHVPLLEESSLW